MKLRARNDVVISSSGKSSLSDAEWGRWFAWYPVTIATSRHSARWVWLEFVERKWSSSRYGGTRRRRYRMSRNLKPDVRQRLQNLEDLTQKLDVALGQARSSDRLR
jgi:hypothetical protein